MTDDIICNNLWYFCLVLWWVYIHLRFNCACVQSYQKMSTAYLLNEYKPTFMCSTRVSLSCVVFCFCKRVIFVLLHPRLLVFLVSVPIRGENETQGPVP